MKNRYVGGVLALAASIAVGLIAFYYFKYEAFSKISTQLLVLFSILAGLLAQVMVFTGMVVTPTLLEGNRLSALEVALEDQQEEWRIQFFLYIAAVAACASPEMFAKSGPVILQSEFIQRVYVGVSVALVFAASVRSLRIPTAIIRLQRLRFLAIKDEVKIAAEMRRGTTPPESGSVGSRKFQPPAVHPDHGAVVDLSRLRG